MEATKDMEDVFVDFNIYNDTGDMIIHQKTKYISANSFQFKRGVPSLVDIKVYSPNLAPGSYVMDVYIYQEGIHKEVLFWAVDIPLCRVNSNNPNKEAASNYLDEMKSLTYPKATIRKIV
jgi:hypothetical protein